jgi:6-phosphofructokinase 1
MVMEVFGRYAGHTAFRAGIASDADAILIPEIPSDFDVLYAHCKERYFHRIAASDVKAGTYLILVAEGLKDASGKELVDESAGIDAFGHKRLAGAGKYVCDQLTKRFKSDPEMPKLMQREKMYVKGINEIPEIRAVTPGHLVRCGHSSVYDANFGKEAGAAAITLLKNNLSGVTVSGIQNGKVQYMETPQAIKQRYVDLSVVALHEQLGTCFGRRVQDSILESEKKDGAVERFL